MQFHKTGLCHQKQNSESKISITSSTNISVFTIIVSHITVITIGIFTEIIFGKLTAVISVLRSRLNKSCRNKS